MMSNFASNTTNKLSQLPSRYFGAASSTPKQSSSRYQPNKMTFGAPKFEDSPHLNKQGYAGTQQDLSQKKIERQRKLIVYDTKKSKPVLQINFYSKIIKLEMNYSFLLVASKDHIFVFQLKDMQRIASIKAPNHLLRIALSPNLAIDETN